eukprot:1141075-Pelagomonas_calceolata.AAC.3
MPFKTNRYHQHKTRSLFSRGLQGGLLGARWRRTGEGKSRRPGAWQATLQIPIRSVPGSLLG